MIYYDVEELPPNEELKLVSIGIPCLIERNFLLARFEKKVYPQGDFILSRSKEQKQRFLRNVIWFSIMCGLRITIVIRLDEKRVVLPRGIFETTYEEDLEAYRKKQSVLHKLYSNIPTEGSM